MLGLREPRRLGHLQLRHLGANEAALREQLVGALDAGLRFRSTRLDTLAQPGDLLRDPPLALVLGALSLMGLSIFGPGIATGLVSGAPQLGAGAAVGTGLAVAGIGAAGVMGASAGLSGAASAVGGGGRMTAAAARGGAYLAGSTSSAYGAGASGQSRMGAVAAGLGGVTRAGASAAIQPVRQAASRAAASLKSSYAAGRAAATGGPSSPATAAGASAAQTPLASGAPPAWAARMKRSQTLSHGATAAAHAVRSGDHGGGSMSVSLHQDDHK